MNYKKIGGSIYLVYRNFTKNPMIDADIINRCRCGLLKKFNKLTQNIDELQKKISRFFYFVY
jgi:hypothetical protein